MRIALSMKNKVDFINGSTVRPNSTDQVRLKAWMRNNNVVISWILNSVSKEISPTIIYLESAYDIWKELKDQFQQSNGPRIIQIKRDLMNLAQGQESVSIYFIKIKSFWDELSNFNVHCTCGLCTCGGAKEAEQTMRFLMGLNDSFSQIRGQILLMEPIPSVNKIFSLIIQEERQRNIGSNQSLSTTMAFNVRNCSNVQNKFHSSAVGSYKKNQSPFCTHCKRTGHTQDKCYRLHGFPPGYRNHNRTNDSRANTLSTNSVMSTHELHEAENKSLPIGFDEVLTGVTQDQCKQLIFALSGKIASANIVTTSDNQTNDQSYKSSISQQHAYPDQTQENDWQG